MQRSSITKIGARRQPGELAHNELKVALNRGEIRAGLINSRLPSSPNMPIGEDPAVIGEISYSASGCFDGWASAKAGTAMQVS